MYKIKANYWVLLEMLLVEQFSNLLVIWACQTVPSKSGSINLKKTLMYIYMQKFNFIQFLFHKILYTLRNITIWLAECILPHNSRLTISWDKGLHWNISGILHFQIIPQKVNLMALLSLKISHKIWYSYKN